MKLKFLKEIKINDLSYAPETVVEIEDQPTCDQLIADGSAIEYTAEMEAQDKADVEAAQQAAEDEAVKQEAERIKVEQKSFKASNKNTEAKGAKNMKGLMGKAVAQMRVEKKSVDGVAGTTATEYLGYVTGGNKVWDKLRKMSIKGNLRIVYANGAPTVSTVGEGSANAQSAIPISKTATEIKKFASFKVPREYFEDVDGLDAYLSGGVSAFALKAIVAELIAGTATGTSYAGLEGIQASADCKSAEFASMAAPTKAELLAWKNLVHPDLRDGTVFILNPTFWAGCESALLSEANVGNQLITIGKDCTMFGYPVIVTESATVPVCGNLDQYVIGVGRDLEITQQDEVATDSVITGVGIRVAGGIAWKADATYGAFVKAVVAVG